MDTSPNLLLPYIMAAQAQKHVTHNEAIRALDALLQIAVADRDLAGPPDSPADGARYIVATSPTGGWSGKQGQIAAWQDGAWAFYPPREGWIAWISDEDMLVAWSGSAWVAAGGVDPAAGLQNLTMLGVNATADTTNRLSVASAATLLNHAGDGHQLKINKAAAGSTASLLFQTGFSGRAEIGTTGTDQFEFKVSGDGAAWYTPLQVLPSGCVAQTADGGANGQSQLKARASGSTTSQRASLAFYPTFGSYPADTAPRRCADIIAGFTSVWGTEYLALNVGLNGAANDGEQLGTEILRLNADRSVVPGADNAQSLGTAVKRWAQIYAANGTIQTSDARDKEIAAPLASAAARMVDAVEPVLFRWRSGGEQQIQSGTTKILLGGVEQDWPAYTSMPRKGQRLHAGFRAQDIKRAMDATGTEFGAWGLDDPNSPDSRQWTRPDQLVAVLWAALKETRAELKALQTPTGT